MPLDSRVKILLWLSARTGQSFRPDVTVEALRAGYLKTNKQFGLKQPTGVTTRELSIPASDGATVHARMYVPDNAGEGPLPVLLYFHGGGWVIGDVEAYDGLTRWFAHEGRIAVISVDYRLGPEHHFPRGFEDSFDALKYVQQNAASLNIDPAKIAVGGDSAGGGLASALSVYAEARGLEKPAYAFLIYPSVDGPGRYPSRGEYHGNLPLTPATIEWFGQRAASDAAHKHDPLYVTIDAPNPEKHPPAYVLAAQYDPLVDEGRAYYERLRAAGVDATYDLRATLPHAFVNLAGVIPEAKKALADGIRATAAALGVRPVAAITGAGSGIGRALALQLADLGYALSLADRNEAGLHETASLIGTTTTVTTTVLDVADRRAVEDWAADTLRDHRRIDVVVNNAGVSIAGDVSELSIEEIEWLMNINFWGTVYGVKAFLPAMERQREGTIVNLSSVFGLIGPPGQSAYAASKFAVRGFSESLRGEVAEHGIHVVTVHPGGIATNIAKQSRIAAAADQELSRARAEFFDREMLTQTPEKAARLIIKGILGKKDRVLIGTDALQIDVFSRALGPAASKFLAAQATKGLPAELQRNGASTSKV